MPGPNGVITITSDPDIALRAENKTASLALEALSEALTPEELTTLRSMHWYALVLNKRFLTPFRDDILNRRQVSVGDRGVLPTRT